MRILIWAVILASALWGGYWFIGSAGFEKGLAAWFDERRSAGWVADYSDIKTRGFPNRFDTTISDLELADTRAGLAWSAPFFQIFTLSYRPNHIVVAFPNQQSLSTPIEKLNLTSEIMRGSIVFAPDSSLEVQRSAIELTGLDITSDAGWNASVSVGEFATRIGKAENSQDVFFEAQQLKPATEIMNFLDPGSLLPDHLSGVRIDLTAGFTAPWDRFAVEQERPQLTDLNIKTFIAGWGDIVLEATGKLDVDAEGWPSGTLNVRAKEWRDMLRVASETGAIPAGFMPMIEGALATLAQASGNPETIDAPLKFGGRTIFLAGIPIGQAPNLSLR